MPNSLHTTGTSEGSSKALPIELLSTKAAAMQLGLAQITLAKWRCAGGGPPFIRLGARIMYPAAELRAWVASQPRYGSTAEADTAGPASA